MMTGKGEVTTRGGTIVPLTINMVSVDGPSRTGHLLCDTSAFEPTAFLYPLRLKCDDGSKLDIAVTNYSDRHISFVGRLAA